MREPAMDEFEQLVEDEKERWPPRDALPARAAEGSSGASMAAAQLAIRVAVDGFTAWHQEHCPGPRHGSALCDGKSRWGMCGGKLQGRTCREGYEK